MTNPRTITVFTGTADSTMQDLEDTSLATSLEDNGVGLYGHGNGIYWMVANNHMQALANAWQQAGTGVAEFGMSFGYASVSVQVTNNGTNTQSIQVGDTFTSSNGSTYVVMADPGQPGVSVLNSANKNGYVANNDLGYYSLSAGQTITLTLEATSIGTNADASSSNQVTTYHGQASNISVSASSTTEISDGSSGTDITSYFTGGTNAPMYYLYQKYGYAPLQGNVNITGTYMSAQDANTWSTWVDSARQAGVLNLAPITSYNGLNFNSANDFATSTYWASTRAAILKGGGVSFDMPPEFALTFTNAWYPQFGQAANTYITFVEYQIKWATSEGLRTSVIISPQDADTQHGGLLAETKALVQRLTDDGALPSQFIVENYGNTTNTYSSDSNSLNSVATYLATVQTTPSNSEARQEVVGGTAPNLMMSGIRPTVTLNGYNTTTTLYDAANLFASGTPGNVTVTLHLDTTGLVLSSTLGQASDHGNTWTYTGSVTDVSTLLQHLSVTNATTGLADGTANLSLNFTDAQSTITGTTAISYQGSTNTTMDAGSSATITRTTTSIIVGQDSDLTYHGTAGIIADGTFRTLTLDNSGGDNAIAIGLTGQGTLTNIQGTAGITVESAGNLHLANSAAFLMVNGGSVTKSGDAALTANGSAQAINIQGAQNYLNMALTGTGTISQASGSIGITLTSDAANLIVDHSVVYATVDKGTINTGDGAYVNMYGTDNGGNIYANVNGGVLTYQALRNANASFHVGNGTAKLDYGVGYTADYQDMSAYSLSIVSNLQPNNGVLFATHLHALNDTQITYLAGDAIIQEAGQAGSIVVKGVAAGGISLFTGMNGVDFSQAQGSNSLLIAVNQGASSTAITSGAYTSSANQSVFNTTGVDATLTVGNGPMTQLNVDAAKGGTTTIAHSSNTNIALTFSDLASNATLTSTYTNNQTTITGGSARVVLDGHYQVGTTHGVGTMDLSVLTNTNTIAVGLTTLG